MAPRRLARAVLLVAVLSLTACTSSSSSPGSSSPSSHGSSSANPLPTSPSPAAPDAAPTNTAQVGVIGDSLTAEMIDYGQLEPALVELGWAEDDIRLDGVWGRPIDGPGPGSTSATIQAWRADGFDPRVWLIALGTNDASEPVSQWQQEIRGVLNTINEGPAGNYTIYWVTTGYRDADVNNQSLFLQTMQEIAGDYPNVVVADYGAFLDSHRDDPNWEAMWSDPVHHSEAGYQTLRTPFYVTTLQPEAPS